jgi:hypothetical protein
MGKAAARLVTDFYGGGNSREHFNRTNEQVQ